ncbi:MAG TPA: metal-dependent hydrolase [Vicinamibacterales bacterium]|nr:metal-dependent hydrolase [Vicinamibacterales bacterium]HPW21529.1 metal-dependent hydrolase [Vicinamibacterales bacterium]
MPLSGLSVTWFGHSTFLLTSPGGRRVLVDPWLDGNPSCPAGARVDAADVILVTHGHFDHVHDAAPVAKRTGATVVGIFELCQWLEGMDVEKTSGMNKGGSQDLCGITFTMVDARHSSSFAGEGGAVYLGEAAGYVVTFENGLRVYVAGDTSVFGDMRLIAELYRPTVAFLPIGGHFTMDPVEAARACELLGVRAVIPMHYGTFPVLKGRPAQLRELVAPLGVDVIEAVPGETLS